MGQDLHPFIEYDRETNGRFEGLIISFNEGEFFVLRNMPCFNALAGYFRCEREYSVEDYEYYKSDPKLQPLYAPRGIPRKVSCAVAERYYAYICKEKEKWRFSNNYPLLTTSEEEAAKWVEKGWSHYGGDSNVTHHHSNQPYQWVSYPDWHCPGWLRLNEFQKVVERAKLEPDYQEGCEFEIFLMIMERIENRLGSGTTRLVFWFDN